MLPRLRPRAQPAASQSPWRIPAAGQGCRLLGRAGALAAFCGARRTVPRAVRAEGVRVFRHFDREQKRHGLTARLRPGSESSGQRHLRPDPVRGQGRAAQRAHRKMRVRAAQQQTPQRQPTAPDERRQRQGQRDPRQPPWRGVRLQQIAADPQRERQRVAGQRGQDLRPMIRARRANRARLGRSHRRGPYCRVEVLNPTFVNIT